jgi:DNA-binding SARP family transcriptional activator
MDRRIAAVLWTQGSEEEAVALWLHHDLYAELARRLPTVFPDLLSAAQLRRAQAWMRLRPQQQGRAQPWQDCWEGLCRVAQTPVDARDLLQRAYAAFANNGDALGAMCALTGIIESFINQWGDFHPLDRWIPEMDRLLEAGLKLPDDVLQRAQVALFMAMMYRQPGNPALAPLVGTMQHIAERCLHQPLRAYAAAQLLLYQCWWRGDMVAGRLVAELAPGLEAGAQLAPAVRIAWLAVQSIYGGLVCTDAAPTTAQLDAALALAKRSDIHLWDSLLLGQALWCSLTTGDLDAARILVRRMAASLRPQRHLDHSYYHCLGAVLALHEADPAAMRAHAQAALRCARDAGVPWAEGVVLCAVARAQALQGDSSAARISLDEAERIAGNIASDTVRFDVLLARLELGLGQGDGQGQGQGQVQGHGLTQDQAQGQTGADATLVAWMQLWSRCGFHNFPWWRSKVVAGLCAHALELGIEPAFAHKIIRARRLLPPANQPVPQAWPLPLHIGVIGRFSITIDGRSVAASGKIPKKPLELLKLLIAQGGQGSRPELAAMLWRHLDDAAGEQVLKVTLHRLRNLIGHEVVLCHAGRVALDTHRCRVDLLDFFAALAQVEVAPAQHGELLFALLRQHAGGVFADDPGTEWAAAVRASLCSRLLRALHAGLTSWRAQGAWLHLLACCQFGLTLDARDEACHLGLIEACIELGRSQDDAQAAYLRCVNLMPAAREPAFGAAIYARLNAPFVSAE